jgi:hypothetical protein
VIQKGSRRHHCHRRNSVAGERHASVGHQFFCAHHYFVLVARHGLGKYDRFVSFSNTHLVDPINWMPRHAPLRIDPKL